jgi:drug/metabolite transporter (DMT)-like permease
MAVMVASSVNISFGGLVLRSMEDADAWQINFYRSLAFGTVIGAIMLFRYGNESAARVRQIGRPGICGGLLLSAAGITFLQAITNTTVANTLFMLSAIPFITAALAWVFLREHLRRATLVTMVAAALGVCVMVAEGLGTGSSYGNLMAFGTALCFSGFAVIVRRHRQVDMLPALMVAAVVIALLAVVLRWDDLAISPHDILLCFLWGGVLSGLGNAMFIFASRHLVAAELTLFMLLEFALGPIWVWIFINEVPTDLTVLGGAIVILSVCVRALTELRRRSPRLARGRPSPM